MTDTAENGLQTVYSFDQAGHYVGEALAQTDPLDGGLLLPDNCVTFAPPIKSNCYYTINAEKTAWEEHQWPGDAAGCVGIFIEHTDHCEWAEKMRKRMEELCEASTKYRIVRDEPDLTMTVEAVPEKTEEEAASEEAEQALRDFDAQISALKDRMALAQLTGDDELIAQLKADYQALMSTEG